MERAVKAVLLSCKRRCGHGIQRMKDYGMQHDDRRPFCMIDHHWFIKKSCEEVQKHFFTAFFILNYLIR